MSDILARLIAVGAPADLVAEIALEMARAEVAQEIIAQHEADKERKRAGNAERQRRFKAKQREVTEDNAGNALEALPNVSKSAPDKKPPQTPHKINPEKVPPIIPPWVPAEAWAGFEEMRKRIRKPMTDRARELAVIELDRLRGEGFEPADVLNHCTMNSYQGIFPPPKGRARASPEMASPC